MRKSNLIGISAAVSLLVVGASQAFAAPSTDPAPPVDHYVALGDSFTSGPLIPEQRPDPAGCARSTNNYPSILAERLDVVEFTDVSCGGAQTADMTRPQPLEGGEQNAPQFDALRADTDLVTVGIGGNDFGLFGNLVGVCPELRESDPTGAPCQAHFTEDGQDTLLARMPELTERISAVVRGITERAPEAEVLVINYPRLAPEEGFCPERLPFAEGDYAWADEVERAIGTALADGAATGGERVRFVDVYEPSTGHDICAPADAAWVNGQHDQPDAARYHPTKLGMAGMADVINNAYAPTH
ncbi:GDSL-like lipase/acylhydrolase family protein [Tamaricihabitans halophyticus]|uniref:GDSL-like lipase/acylhydrolase family protein n=1 Tax=Tamaricihabitans halophyticus TaxID=1262583 RepID=A0A4R2QJB7_9PSEU|nr:SGNH/GDSL hydrolase family protein [Tamaricihabitans halophyticus]TCP48578.1 GDSL-like lipase/acylhydrolase family protein [Tamaricihabitans halophyticus]